MHTGKGKVLRIDDESGRLGEIFSGVLSLEECMEVYIQKFVYEEDKDMVREAASRARLKRELAESKQCYMNYRAFKNGEMV